jgi:TfoX/Sxy family transcriptional regulator of competence genes
VAYDDALANRVRLALGNARPVQEKRMFGGLMFMVRGKMCVSVGRDRLMCRIDPALHEVVVERKGCRTVIMKGRQYRGYVHIDGRILQSRRQLDNDRLRDPEGQSAMAST